MIFDAPSQKAPTLVDLCIRCIKSNLRYLSDVGEIEDHLLEEILPRCSLEQVKHIEMRTKRRDLSHLTDKLWRGFYEKEFGGKSTTDVVEKMKQKRVSFLWRELYEAKLKAVDDAQEKSFARIKELYKKEDARKQSRQIQVCSKVPPSNKRGWGGQVSNSKSKILKKARSEFMNSCEVRNIASMKLNSMRGKPSASLPVKSGTTSRKEPVPASTLGSSKLGRR